MSIKMNPLIGNPIAAVICLLIATIFLVLDEFSYINNSKVSRVAKNAVSVSEVSSVNNNKLIYFTGRLKSDDIIADELVSVKAIVLERNIEEYKEVEEIASKHHRKILRWERTFSSFPYNDDQKSFNCGQTEKRASNVSIGGFQLQPGAIRHLKASDTYGFLPGLPYGSNLTLSGTYYYTGHPNSPNIGDYRVSYNYLPSDKTYSVIAKQVGNTLTPYNDKNTNIFIIEKGSVSKQKLLENYTVKNFMSTNTTRLLMFLLIWFAMTCLISFISFVFPKLGINVGAIKNYGFKETFLVALMYFSALIALTWFGANILVSIFFLIVIGLICKYLSTL